MAKLLLHAHSVEGLRDVDSILHDAGFSMAEVAHDNDLGVVTIPFHPFPTQDVPILEPYAASRECGRAPTVARH